jgi:hypothetical protein
MKIHEQQGLTLNQIGKSTQKTGIEKGDFQSIMDKITSNSVGSEADVSSSSQLPPMGGVDMIFNSMTVDGASDTNTKEQVLTNLKETLDLVEHYSQRLADTSLPSNQLSTLVDQLEKNMEGLKDMSSVSGVDDRLKSIITDVTGSVGVEIEKFRRGDYA